MSRKGSLAIEPRKAKVACGTEVLCRQRGGGGAVLMYTLLLGALSGVRIYCGMHGGDGAVLLYASSIIALPSNSHPSRSLLAAYLAACLSCAWLGPSTTVFAVCRLPPVWTSTGPLKSPGPAVAGLASPRRAATLARGGS